MNDKQAQGKSEGFTRTWTEDRVFLDYDTKVAVVVQKSNDRTPRFRQELVSVLEDGRRFSRMGVQATGFRTGTIKVVNLAPVVARLFQEAYEYMHERLQAQEDSFIERAARGPGLKAPMGIKSLGKRDGARKGYTKDKAP